MADENQTMMQTAGSDLKNWFALPENRAALLQFGLSLMQPPQWGQGPGAQIASAVGEGVEAQQRAVAARAAGQQQQQELAIKQQEADASTMRARKSGGLSATALFSANRRAEEKWGEFLDDALDEEALDADARQALLADNDWLMKKEDEFAKLYPSMARPRAGRTPKAPAGAPSGGEAPETPPGMPPDQASALELARKAIASGKSRDAVIKRLQDFGYSAEGL